MTRRYLGVVVGLAICAAGCGGSDGPRPAAPGARGASTAAGPMDKSAYPVFPDPDAGADPAVPAEQGGRGFTGEGWETNTAFDLIGDPRAVKGGLFRESTADYPATLRYIGPNVSTWNQMLHGMAYEPLLGQDPITLDYIPVLATHWQVSEDKQTFRFRLDPNARFSDGEPVTSDDVVASWKLYVDRTVQSPFHNAEYSKFEQPVAESPYIVRVRAKQKSWTSLMIFSSMFVYPEHVLKTMIGADYIRDWNDRMLPGSGPYTVTAADQDKGKSVTLRRRPDYWAEKYRRNIGQSNFDQIRYVVVRDENLEFEMFKKGDLDYYVVRRAQQWAEEFDFDKMQRGWIQRRKIWNHKPESVQGIAFNMRQAPYSDLRVRKALRHLYNRELMVEKLMFGEYQLMDSFFPYTVYENPSNEKIRYDPAKAVALLAEAGWNTRNAQGQLVRDGKPLVIEVLYYTRGFEKYYTIFQDDLRKVGVTLNLRYVTPETGFKILDDLAFGMFSVGYGGGSAFPLPSQFFESSRADQKASNNVTGFKNARADEIFKAYEVEFDLKKRIPLLQELDGIVMSQHPYIFEWNAPFTRVAYWNRFGQPKGLITRLGDYRDPPGLWWHDRAAGQRLDAAMGSNGSLPVGPLDDKHWLEYQRVEETEGATAETTAP